MHILWVTGRTFGKDLCQTTQIQVANALKRKGVKVTFVAPDSTIASNHVNKEGHGFCQGISISSIPGLKSVTFERSLRKALPMILDIEKPDVAVCDWRGARGAWGAFEKANIPWAMVDRGPPAYQTLLGRLQWLHYDRAWRSAGKKAASCFTVSKAHGEFVKKRFSLTTPIITLPAAADATIFSVSAAVREKDVPGIDRPLRIVYHGRLDNSRNVIDLVLVADQLRHSGIETELLLFGRGSAERRLHKLSNKHNWLTVLPAQPFSEVPKLLANMDVGLLPMGDHLVWRTASPLKLFEYAASALPIVATDIAAHRLEENPEWIGLVATNQMVEGMVRILQSWVVDERIKELGTMARDQLIARYTWDHAIEEAITILKRISATGLDK